MVTKSEHIELKEMIIEKMRQKLLVTAPKKTWGGRYVVSSPKNSTV